MAKLVNRYPISALAGAFDHNLAIVVGINAYAHVRTLRTARPDAERMAELLRNVGRDKDCYEVIERYDEKATAAELSTLLFETLPALVRQKGEKTRVLFYFAGHGDAQDAGDGLKGFLFPQDARPEDESTLLPMSKVQDVVAGLDCQHILLIIDCCSAGAMARSQTTRGALLPRPLYWDYLQRYVGRQARQVLTSAAYQERALDVDPGYQLGVRDPEDGRAHSPFAQALFEALDPELEGEGDIYRAGRDGVVTATELYQYVSDALFRRLGDKQTPHLWTLPNKGHDSGEFVFLLPGVRMELEPAPDLSKPTHNPWPGLCAYRREQADLFAGRDQDILDLAKLVNTKQLVVVLGPSSSGKTSLVQAGLMPWLEHQARNEQNPDSKSWHILPLLSLGQTPVTTLARFLAEQLADVEKLNEEFEGDPSDPTDLLAVWLRNNPTSRLLLVLDTEEALFDDTSVDERTRLWTLLATMAQQDVLHAVLIMRSDQWHVAAGGQLVTNAASLQSQKPFVLKSMNDVNLRQAVAVPAAARFVFLGTSELKSETLVDKLAEAVADQPAGLPLLSETLHQMFLRYADDCRQGLRADRTLTTEDYLAVGQIGGVAAKLANDFYNEQPDDFHRQTIQRVLMRLVDVEEGRYTRRRAQLAEFDYPDPQATGRARTIIAGLAQRGLVVIGADPEDNPYVELGHIALTRDWSILNGWLVDPDTAWGLQQELNAQVKLWAPNKPKDKLWDRNPKLTEVQKVAWPTPNKRRGLSGILFDWWSVLFPNTQPQADSGWLNANEVDFVSITLAERACFWRRVVGIIIVVMLFLTVLGGIAWWQRGIAVDKQAVAEREARRSMAGEFAADAKAALSDDSDTSGSLSLILARQAVMTTWLPDGIVTINADAALREAVAAAPPYVMTLPPARHNGFVYAAEYSPNGDTIVTAGEDETARVWDVNTGEQLLLLAGHTRGVNSAVFSPDGRQIVTASDDGTARIWDATTGKELRVLNGDSWAITSAVFSPDGRQILTARANGAIRVRDISTTSELRLLNNDFGGATSADYSPDGKYIVTTYSGGTSLVWDATSGEELHRLAGHTDKVNSAVFSPDGQQIVTASDDRTAIIWDADTGDLLRRLSGHTDYVNTGVFNPNNSRQIVTASSDGKARIWDIDTGNLIYVFAINNGRVWSATYSPDGQNVVTTGRDGVIWVWDIAEARAIQQIGGHLKDVNYASFSPDGQQIVTASDDGTGRIWDAATGNELGQIVGHRAEVATAEFSPDSRYIVTASADNTARIWDVATKEELRKLIGHGGRANSAEFSPDGKRIITASSDGTARIWDARTGEELHRLTGHSGWVNSAEFSPNGRYAVTSSADGTARIWDANTGMEIRQLSGHNSSVASAAFSPDGRHIVTASTDKTIRIWDSATGQEVLQLADDAWAFTSAVFSPPDGRYILTTSWTRDPRIWDAATGKELQQLSGHNAFVNSAVYSPDGSFIVTASDDRTARIWDAGIATQGFQFSGHSGAVKSAEYSADGLYIVTASCDKTTRIWDATTREELRQLDHTCRDNTAFCCVETASFSPDGTQIVTGSSDKRARIWNAATGEMLQELGGHNASVTSAAYSPDSKYIVTGSDDGTARIWDAANGEELRILRGYAYAIFTVAYSPDGNHIVTGGDPGTVSIWDVATNSEPRLLIGHDKRVFSVSYSPDGTQIVTGGDDGTVRIWDAATGEELCQIVLPKSLWTTSAVFSQDGHYILTAHTDGTARVWDSETRNEFRRLAGHNKRVNSTAFSPDGETIITASDEDTPRIWPSIGDLLVESERLIQRDPPQMTSDERETFGITSTIGVRYERP